MRHVDEGTIHAWLDEQITDPAEAAWIETHLRDCAACRGRLADEQAAFDGARTLLDATALTAGRPSFDALAAKAARDIPEAAVPAGERTRRRRERFVQLSWAASLALAVGLGWTARELTNRDATRPEPPQATAEPSPAADARVGNTAPAPSEPAPTPGLTEPPARATAAPPAGAATPSRQAANADAQPSERRLRAAPGVAVAESGGSTSTAETIVQPVPQPTAAAATAAPPAAPPPPAASAAQSDLASAPLVAPRLERVAVADGQWRAVPRTEAAARTGMPLYGIDGLEPQYTGLSADGAVVRTLYRLESGEQVELVQQRNVPGAPPVDPRLAAGAGNALVDAQSTRRALETGRGGGAERQLVAPQPFTIVRGNMRLTLQTSSGADLAALGMRLRVD